MAPDPAKRVVAVVLPQGTDREQIRPGGACDVKTLAREAGVSRASFHRTRGHLEDEFGKRRAVARAAGQQPDPPRARTARSRDLNAIPLSTWERLVTNPGRARDPGEYPPAITEAWVP